MTSKNKKNSGFNNLRELDIVSISDGANLKENFVQKDIDQQSAKEENFVKKSLNIPSDFDYIIRTAKKERKIIGSINAYIIEALRRRMIEEGLIRS